MQGGNRRGKIAVFYKLPENIVDNKFNVEDADFYLLGQNDYQMFGFDAECISST